MLFDNDWEVSKISQNVWKRVVSSFLKNMFSSIISLTILLPGRHHLNCQGTIATASMNRLKTYKVKNIYVSGFNISTSPLASADEFLKKVLLGKYILVCTCPNGQAAFLSTIHFYYRKMAQIPRNMLRMPQNSNEMVLKSLTPWEIIHAFLAYVITYFGQAKSYFGQVTTCPAVKLVLKFMLVPVFPSILKWYKLTIVWLQDLEQWLRYQPLWRE